MKLHFPHSYELSEATDRVRALTDYWSKRYGITTEWNGSQATVAGKVRGVNFNGNIVIDEAALNADLKVGFLAEKLGGKSYVERKIKEYLSPENDLEELRSRID